MKLHVAGKPKDATANRYRGADKTWHLLMRGSDWPTVGCEFAHTGLAHGQERRSSDYSVVNISGVAPSMPSRLMTKTPSVAESHVRD